ncbi:MAG: hypothetical protein KC451_09000 [Amylibacter sp.]|nr:hypothetical protein [Amylibacter sp.]
MKNDTCVGDLLVRGWWAAGRCASVVLSGFVYKTLSSTPDPMGRRFGWVWASKLGCLDLAG